MHSRVQGLKIAYKLTGRGHDVVLLHGWGANLQVFKPVHQHLESCFRVLSVDLPGFGESDPPESSLSTGDYADVLQELFHVLDVKKPILIGHSFGGRLAIQLGARGGIHKIVLVDSAGIRPRRGIRYYIKVYAYKFIRSVLTLPGIRKVFPATLPDRVARFFASKDYREVSGVMRETLVKTVNEDLRDLLPRIQVPTLLVWGERDLATPVSAAKVMEARIPDSGLVVLKGAGHYSFLDSFREFASILDAFLKDDYQAEQ